MGAAGRNPAASSPSVTARMRSQRERDTTTELRIRRLLWRNGHRYRKHYRALPGLRREVDIAFPGKKVAVFVDGCFWHGCTEHKSTPKANRKWWLDKIEENRRRDRDTDERLKKLGWTVLRVWEHEDPHSAVDRIVRLLTQG
ncbi:very short patch repair endonuclease [Saccharomonospora glauca]|uniref:DNA mismatch endonuclease Vsr n=1 Tax=Saccharomonospora glauca K62 TaxID=928724 RepID=I1D7Q8_9PSEU|nr:very short patch repair endonuclease [Saccharomonospora glauca]EIF00983.1 DNA mismatch endonuclease Vsr [Saccharomonospora glauca K62]